MKTSGLITVLLFAALFLSACGDHSVKFDAVPQTLAPGEKGKVTVKLRAHGKWHINPEAIVMIKFVTPEAVILDKIDLSNEDRQPENIFGTGFTVKEKAQPGQEALKANVYFTICTEEKCRMYNEEHETNLQIK